MLQMVTGFTVTNIICCTPMTAKAILDARSKPLPGGARAEIGIGGGLTQQPLEDLGDPRPAGAFEGMDGVFSLGG